MKNGSSTRRSSCPKKEAAGRFIVPKTSNSCPFTSMVLPIAFHVREKAVGDIGSDHGNRCATAVFLVREEASAAHVDLALLRVLFLYSQQIDAGTVVALVLRPS